ncbi:hypothetical protein D9M72_423080 [compost metagenome]
MCLMNTIQISLDFFRIRQRNVKNSIAYHATFLRRIQPLDFFFGYCIGLGFTNRSPKNKFLPLQLQPKVYWKTDTVLV